MTIDKTSYYAGGNTGILLIHGLAGTPVEMRYIANGLHRAGYTVYCCQLHGHCGSVDDLKKATWHDWLKSVEEALTKLKHCNKIFVGGLSAGSLLALHLAEKFPGKIAGCFLYSPTILLNGWAMPFYMRWLHYLRPSMLWIDMLLSERYPHGIKDDRVRAMIVNSMQSNTTEAGSFHTPLSTMVQFNALSAYMRKRLKNITVPIITFHPREDDFANMSNSMEIASKVSGKCDVVTLDDCYHIITLDRQREYVLYRTIEYIESVIKYQKRIEEKSVLQYTARQRIATK